MTKINKLAKSFTNGDVLSSKQIISRFGFASVNSVTGTIFNLRKEGLSIERYVKGTKSKYALSTARKSLMKDGYSIAA